MTDTQTAFVLVPREPTDEMLEASVSPRDEFLTDAHIAALKDGFAAKYRAMLSAAPKQPESEIGAVAWFIPPDEDVDGSVYQQVSKLHFGEPDLTPLYPQSRIDADAATIAALRAEVAQMHAEHVCLTGNMQDEINFMRGAAAKSRTELEAAEAEVAALKHDVESSGALRLRLNAYRDRAKVAEARVKELEAALANKETDK